MSISIFSVSPPKIQFFRWLLVLAGLLLFALVILVYSPALRATFLWDDEFLVEKNPFIRSPVLGIEVFHHFLLSDTKGEFYRPVQNLSYLVDYWRAGLNAAAFHESNLLIHSLNGLLALLLFYRLLRTLGNTTSRQAFLLALSAIVFWLLHPVHSAIVAYISGRADSLALAFLLLSWLCWEWGVAAASNRKTLGFLLALFFALGACCSKEIALAGLGFFFLYFWIVRLDLSKSLKLKTSLGLLVVFSIYLSLRHLPDPNISTQSSSWVPWSERGNLMIRALGDYARLFFYPQKLFMERQVGIPTGLFTDPVLNDPLFPYLGWIGGAFLVILTVSFFWQGRARPLRMLGVLWFLTMLLPVSNLIPLNATVAEHWLYIPSLGLCLWLAGGWLDCNKSYQRIAVLLFPIALGLIGLRTHLRAQDWMDPETFYLATIRAGGDSVRIRMNLAAECQKKGNFKEAERIYRSILKVLPDFSLGKISLAQTLAKQSRQSETKPISTKPKISSDEIETIRLAYEQNPNSWVCAQSLSNIFLEEGKLQVAFEITKGFASRNWWHAASHLELARFYEVSGQSQAALLLYREAARLDIRDVVTRTKIRQLEAEIPNQI